VTFCTGRRWGLPFLLLHGFRGPLKQRVRDAVLGERLQGSGLFNSVTLRRLVDHHQSGARDHSAPLWSLLMFDASSAAATSSRDGRGAGHRMSRDLRLLTFTSLFPSVARRARIFIESRCSGWCRGRNLRACDRAGALVSIHGRWLGRVRAHCAHPQRNCAVASTCNIRAMSSSLCWLSAKAGLMARAGLRAVQSLLREGEAIDVVDAHYLYPDGVAAAEIARRIGRPFVLSAREPMSI